jgi:hypothetical protein
MFVSYTFAYVKEMLPVGAYNAQAAYHTHVCDFKTFYITWDVIFPAFCFSEKFVDMSSLRYNIITHSLIESRFQCVVKTGKKYQILYNLQKTEKE